MSKDALLPDSPLPRRLWAYLLERFPPAAYTLLVVVFYSSGALVAQALGGGDARWPAAAVVLLVFFHLRVFDEHKDHERDRETHPERLLSRGVVTLALLRRCALAAVLVEAGISAALGTGALTWWALTFGFTGLMLFELGVGAWLGRHIVIYAVTHNPVVALLAIYIWASTGAEFSPAYLWYVGAASLGSLAFEVGRKTNLPDEEVQGVESYSTALGRARAGWLVAGASLACAACVAGLVVALEAPPLAPGVIAGISLLAALVPALTGRKAKAVEGGATLLLLGALAACGVAAW